MVVVVMIPVQRLVRKKSNRFDVLIVSTNQCELNPENI